MRTRKEIEEEFTSIKGRYLDSDELSFQKLKIELLLDIRDLVMKLNE